ncbi:MAG TPA: hypothetical protein VKX25_16180 [Bryobacteraceae bacterium]|jgi:hypothetical protein|nr:hypothetical protein [Bryobacteraceae bacterium]
MAQITIYLPDEVEVRVRKAAKARRQSVSRWIAQQITNDLQSTWPPGVVEAAGALPDFPDLRDIRAGYGKDSQRERIR